MSARKMMLMGAKRGGGALYAAVAPEAIYTGSQLCEFRFSAWLVPYRSETAARDALENAGCSRVGEWRR